MVDSIFQGEVDAGHAPGVVLLVGRCFNNKPDAVLYLNSWGWRENTTANPAERETMTTDTLFDLASVTKPTFTASAVMLLIQDGLLSDEDFAYTYIPGFDQHGKDDIKIKHLLTHTSGLPAYTGVPSSPPRPNPDALITKICGLSEIYNTGEGYTYSCLNFIILARIVENITGESVTSFLKRRLWNELGMIDSTHFPTPAQIARTAPTTPSRRGRVHDPLAYYYTDYVSQNHACGNAGGFSTVQDESRLARILLHKGSLYGKQIYTPAIVEKITTQQTSVAYRTYGWAISGYAKPENQTPESCCIAHSGYTGTYIWLDKFSKTYIIVFSNYVYPDDNAARKSAFRSARADAIWALINHLDIYNGVPEEAWVIDNDAGAPAYTETGAWETSSNPGYADKTYRYATAGEENYADFHAVIPGPGLYRLYAWYREGSDRTADTKYIIHHKNGADTVSIDQRVSGRKGVALGDFDFDSGEYTIRLDARNSSGGGGIVISDAVIVEPLSLASEVVVDNLDAGYSDTENFFSSSASPYRYRQDYRACNPGVGGAATWRLDLPNAGAWEIYEWHNGNSTRSPKAPLTITHFEGADTSYVNQQEKSGQWNLLGTFSFKKGGGVVKLESVADKIVIADAIKARFKPVEVIVDDLDARYSDTEGFFTSSASPLRHDATYRACLTGSGETATWNLELPYAGRWEIFEMHNGNETRTTAAPYAVNHSGGATTIPVNQQEKSGEWNSLGTYTFQKGGGLITLTNEAPGGDFIYVIADAVKAVYLEPATSSCGVIFY